MLRIFHDRPLALVLVVLRFPACLGKRFLQQKLYLLIQ